MAKKKEGTKTAKDGARLQRVIESVKHFFSDEELIEIGAEQSAKIRNLRALIEDKKSVAAEYAAREKTLNAEIYALSNKISGGYERREKPCFVFYGKDHVYWFLCEDLAKLKPADFSTTDDLLEYLLTDEAFSPVKSRRMREDERQKPLFDDADNGNEKAEAPKENQPEVKTD